VVQANEPPTEAVPPVSVELDSDCPTVMALAVGHAVTEGVAIATVSGTELELPAG
jgi:hypothetical protein